MIEIRQMIRNAALASSTLATFIGTRFFYMRPSASPTYPLVVYRRGSGTEEPDVPLHDDVFEFEVHGTNPDTNARISDELRTIFHKAALTVPNGAGGFATMLFQSSDESFEEVTQTFRTLDRYRVLYYDFT